MIFASFGDICFNFLILFALLGPALRMLFKWLNDDGAVQQAAQDGVVRSLTRWLK